MAFAAYIDVCGLTFYEYLTKTFRTGIAAPLKKFFKSLD